MKEHAPIELSMPLTCFSADDPGSWEFVLDRARLLDVCGVDRLVVSDHVIFGEHLEEYARPELGGQVGGRQPTGPDGHWLEPMTLLSVVAGATRTVRLGTSILLAALRRPVVLAKTAATLDQLSGGRLDLGVGVGWQREEYEAAGLAFAQRGRLLDETLDICRTLWRSERATYTSASLSFDSIHMMPKPRQADGVPIWVSGTVNERVLRRIARYGDGWIPWGPAAADLAAALPKVRDALEQAGRDAASLRVVGTLKPMRGRDRSYDLEATMAAVPGLAAAGVTDLRLPIRLPDDHDASGELVSSAVSTFRAAAGRTPHERTSS